LNSNEKELIDLSSLTTDMKEGNKSMPKVEEKGNNIKIDMWNSYW
jgi:hypothetical protein